MARVPVAVLGSGAWGLTLARMIAPRVGRVPVWVRREEVCEELRVHHTHARALPGLELPGNLEPCPDLAAVVRSADLLIFAIPSGVMREVARQAGDFIQADQVLVNAARGLEAATSQRMSQVFMEETCALQLGTLAGPAYAAELSLGRPGALVVGSGFASVVTRLQDLLSSEQLRVYGNSDLLGVELGASLATILALICGLAGGLALGAGTQAVAMNRGLREIARIGQAAGAQPETFYGLAALGDVTAIVLSGASRSYRVGECLARGMSLDEATSLIGAAECVPSTRVALRLARRHHLDAPLVTAMHALLFDGVPASRLIPKLMTRRSIYE